MGKTNKKPQVIRLAKIPRQIFEMTFDDFVLHFDIERAKKLTRGRHPSETFDVTTYEQRFAEDTVRINRNYLRHNKINLRRPLIAGILPSGTLQIIDGNHRIMAALQAGIRYLPVVVLTADETYLILTIYSTRLTGTCVTR